MAVKPKSIGPWGGCDNFNDLDSNVFQPPSSDPRRRDPPPRLAVGENVDLDVDGWAEVRTGLAELTTATAGRQLFPVERESLLLFQDGESIYTYDPAEDASVEIVTGLNPDSVVQFCAHADQVFYTNGTVLGRIAGGAATNWGCSVGPTPSIAAASGSLLVGRYHVALEPIDANGIRHAAALSAVYDLAATGALRVSVSGVDSAATHLRVYVAGPDDDVLYLLGDVAVGSFPYDVTALPVEDTTCKTIGLDPPPAHNFAFSYQNHLMLVAGSVVYPSLSAAAHLYDLHRHQVGRPETILAGAGLVDGFWTVSASGAYWATGETPERWRQWSLKHPCEFCPGSLTINSSALPFLGITEAQPIALFMSSWGLAVAMSGGMMTFPFRDQKIETVTNKYAHFGFVKKDGYRQLAYILSFFVVPGTAAPGPGLTSIGFNGTGVMAAEGNITIQGTAGFSGTGAMAAEGGGDIEGTAGFAGAGSLSATGSQPCAVEENCGGFESHFLADEDVEEFTGGLTVTNQNWTFNAFSAADSRVVVSDDPVIMLLVSQSSGSEGHTYAKIPAPSGGGSVEYTYNYASSILSGSYTSSGYYWISDDGAFDTSGESLVALGDETADTEGTLNITIPDGKYLMFGVSVDNSGSYPASSLSLTCIRADCSVCTDMARAIPTYSVYFGSSNSNNLTYDVTNNGAEFILDNIVVELDNLDSVVGYFGNATDTKFRFYWGSVSVGGSAFTDWSFETPEGNLHTGRRRFVFDVSGLSGDHIVAADAVIQVRVYDNFNDNAPDEESIITDLKYCFNAAE